MTPDGFVELPVPCLIVLVGPSGSGKSAWARRWFRARTIVSSDELRGQVGIDENDQKASRAAFDVLHRIVDERLSRQLTTVVDTLGLSPQLRAEMLAKAAEAKVPAVAVLFDTSPEVCRQRNATRSRPLPKAVIDRQIKDFAEQRDLIADEGFSLVTAPGPVRLVTPEVADGRHPLEQGGDRPIRLRFDLQISAFPWESTRLRDELVEVVQAAERSGFEGIWVMDHLRQIPQVGRHWEPMPEAYVTLSYLAAVTSRVRLGPLVGAVELRNPALLGKMVATLDVLSGGRAICGIGAGWFAQEAEAYGYEHPGPKERLDLLEDTLELLPLLWGPGAPSYEGRRISVPEALCYPRPIQERIPILVGGSGEKRTLRLVAQHASACNLMGPPSVVAQKLSVLHHHCRDVGRDPAEVEVTHLSRALPGADDVELTADVERLRPASMSHEEFMTREGAATIDGMEARYASLAAAGVQTAIVGLADPKPEMVARMGSVIERFR